MMSQRSSKIPLDESISKRKDLWSKTNFTSFDGPRNFGYLCMGQEIPVLNGWTTV
jgi:hypothetical protein